MLALAAVTGLGAQDSADAAGSGQEQAAQNREAEEALLLPEAEPGAETAAPDGPLVSSWDFLRMLLILAAVVAVIYLIFHLLKRGLRRQLPENDMIRLLGTRNLAGNRALHLVELGKTVFLLGAAEGGISLIAEVKDQETLDTLRIESSKARIAPQGFGQFFQSVLKGGKGAGTGIEKGTIDFMKQQRQRLNRL
ncbi:MAG: flagellar biosynthetic protein FliO [Spirochaetales bacterium]|nr:flagellar biosynthetic protein FliO [Spirochaetales bacterium]